MTTARNPRPARHDRDSVVDAAMTILDEHGLADLTMRRLATELEVQPSALYWHFENKQSLLAAVADRIVGAALTPPPSEGDWRLAASQAASRIHDALLTYRDGAEVVLSTHALGLGSDAARRLLADALARGHEPAVAATAATAVLHFVLGHTSLVQQRMQADSVGAAAPGVGLDEQLAGPDRVFDVGIELLLGGLAELQRSRPASPARLQRSAETAG
ncbi:TetR family transcriptional regulator [Microbacterium sp. 18062]|uniref:TetR family transcriptional regulator n=1 Tax=Microbacterium sp. 18062 TaxID=2681410 RepID=UPI001F3C778C|nr:TetR family transcriptional regulator [Microbacterium sp. 18062]